MFNKCILLERYKKTFVTFFFKLFYKLLVISMLWIKFRIILNKILLYICIIWGWIVYRIVRGYCHYPPPLIVCNEGNGYGNTGRGNGGRGREQRKQGPQRTDTMQQGGQEEEQERPNTKSQKNLPSTTRTTPPLSKKDHFGVAKFLRVAIYNPNTQHI